MNYIGNGKGRGVKYFFIFSLILFVIGSVAAKLYFANEFEKNPAVNDFLNRMPVIEIEDGQIVKPENALIVVPFIQGFNSGLIVNTTDSEPMNLNFDNGIYFIKDKAVLKVRDDMNVRVQEIPLEQFGDVVINRSSVLRWVEGIADGFIVFFGFVFFLILWIGFGLLIAVLSLFFVILGNKLPDGAIGRASFVTWSGVITFDLILVLFGYGFSLPAAFGIAAILSIILILRIPAQPKVSESAKPFFDTVAEENQTDTISVAVKTNPVVKADVKKAVKPAVKKTVKQDVKKATKPVTRKAVKKAVKPAAKKAVKQAVKPARKPAKKAAK